MTEKGLDVLNEMRTVADAGALAPADTIRRWLAVLERADDVVADALAQARRDA